MSYTNNPSNWKYNDDIRTKRMEYTSIYTRLACAEGKTGHELRLEAARQFRALCN